ncbi:family 43 glycosylhydrolase [Patescibacteria group bacterium]|nr:family 43 glycosylhydrolase [Patescibacteria group bacterium]
MSLELSIIEPHDVRHPYLPLRVTDICRGADPYVFRRDNEWHLLLQEDLNPDPLGHQGLSGYTIRSAADVEGLGTAEVKPLVVVNDPPNLRQVWAAEIHFDQYLYVSVSDGDNTTHRMHVYKTEGGVVGPWVYLGPLHAPEEDNRWAIDLTVATIMVEGETKDYAVWSGWEHAESNALPEEALARVIPQNLYIAEFISPTHIGPRHHLLSPTEHWCSSEAPVIEGPQALVVENRLVGLLITGNASWTDKYTTCILQYKGGSPLSAASWSLHNQPLFNAGHGIGHGVLIDEGSLLHYVGHRKKVRDYGWADRVVFKATIPKEQFTLTYLKGSTS